MNEDYRKKLVDKGYRVTRIGNIIGEHCHVRIGLIKDAAVSVFYGDSFPAVNQQTLDAFELREYLSGENIPSNDVPPLRCVLDNLMTDGKQLMNLSSRVSSLVVAELAGRDPSSRRPSR